MQVGQGLLGQHARDDDAEGARANDLLHDHAERHRVHVTDLCSGANSTGVPACVLCVNDLVAVKHAENMPAPGTGRPLQLRKTRSGSGRVVPPTERREALLRHHREMCAGVSPPLPVWNTKSAVKVASGIKWQGEGRRPSDKTRAASGKSDSKGSKGCGCGTRGHTCSGPDGWHTECRGPECAANRRCRGSGNHQQSGCECATGTSTRTTHCSAPATACASGCRAASCQDGSARLK